MYYCSKSFISFFIIPLIHFNAANLVRLLCGGLRLIACTIPISPTFRAVAILRLFSLVLIAFSTSFFKYIKIFFLILANVNNIIIHL